MAKLNKERVGERFKTNEGYEVVIVEYNNANDLLVEFQNERKTIVPTFYKCCKKGTIKNPYHPSIFGIGYIGEGEYNVSINGKQTKEYSEWRSMLTRCYDKKYKVKRPTYEDCIVDEYFHNFQNYCKWREDGYYEIEGERMHLDKDILYKGNKIYTPDKCIFVPERINTLFVRSNAIRGDCPIGVCYHKDRNKYIAYCNTIINNKKERVFLGYYNTSEEAFKVYKEFKEAYIKQVADEYKGRIPDRLYEAMYRWEVEITD